MAEETIRKYQTRRPVQIGERFGRLVVIERAQNVGGGDSRFLCKCDCGNTNVILGYSLRRGATFSCGCYQRERVRQASTKHGLRGSPEFQAWIAMNHRCKNPKCKSFVNYGGRGIAVCDRWQNLQNFLDDMGPRPTPRHTLERKDNNANYGPENCVWATMKDQQNNRRNNRIVNFNGEALTLAQACERSGVNQATAESRINHGWPEEKWFSPARRKRPS